MTIDLIRFLQSWISNQTMNVYFVLQIPLRKIGITQYSSMHTTRYVFFYINISRKYINFQMNKCLPCVCHCNCVSTSTLAQYLRMLHHQSLSHRKMHYFYNNYIFFRLCIPLFNTAPMLMSQNLVTSQCMAFPESQSVFLWMEKCIHFSMINISG